MVNEYLFHSKDEMLEWIKNNFSHEPIWIVFDKRDIQGKLTQEEALDIALCYGWIDGLVNKIDDVYFKKYFAQRRPKSVWSEKNKRSIDRLIKEGKMTEHGLKIINIAKNNGSYDKGDAPPDDFSVETFDTIIKTYEKAYANFCQMSASVKKLYALTYFTAKKAETREKRLKEIVDRLEKNLKPMERESSFKS